MGFGLGWGDCKVGFFLIEGWMDGYFDRGWEVVGMDVGTEGG